MTIRVHQTEAPVNIITRTSSGIVAARRFVKIDGSQATQGSLSLGVAREETASRAEMAVIIEGTALVTAGCVLAAGDQVTSDADGKAVIAYNTEYINGVVLSACDAEDQLVEIQLAGGVPAVKSTVSTTTSTTTTTTTSTTTTST